MKNRNNLDDPNYNQSQNRVTIQDNKAKVLWVVLGVIAAIVAIVVIVAFVVQGGNSGSKVKYGMYFDYYDDNGDGWVDRMYSKDLDRWSNVPTGNLFMEDVG